MRYWGLNLADESGNAIWVKVAAEDREKAQSAILELACEMAAIHRDYQGWGDVEVKPWYCHHHNPEDWTGVMVKPRAVDPEEGKKAILRMTHLLASSVWRMDVQRQRVGWFYELAKNQEPPRIWWTED